MSGPVVCAPLLAEFLALRGRVRHAGLLRTGMGLRRSRQSAERLDGSATAVMVAGVAGSLQESVRPGHVVVADTVQGDDGRSVGCFGAEELSAALRRQGFVVHQGPLLSSRRLIAGRHRRAASTTGALAVDMESIELAPRTSAVPFAVVRVVVDAPGAALWRPSTAWRGWQALRTLRAVGPVLDEWFAEQNRRTETLAGPGVVPAYRVEPEQTREVV